MQRFLTDNPVLLSYKSKKTITKYEQKLIQLGKKYIPDFIIVESGNATLVEIESPNKKIYNKGMEFTSKFSQAINQLRKWKTHLKDPINLASANKDIPEINANFKLKLIIGRGSELSEPELTHLKNHDSEIEIITYGDLISENEQIIQNYSKL